ncbi:hypothetical protein F5050DRAFT_1728270 [Lentinula boryana]|uniref:CFEM domain-containing protein n=1 Tax=Lentinula boryana TaxID=40481 RepID=A0ABQ8QQP4_9AGAR|nr:hypothetical protein F5050DRAFT_1728270 [Lentinula boryana]
MPPPMAPSTSWRTLLLTTLALTAVTPGLTQSNSTLPLCADSCSVVVAAEVGCNVDDDSCCTNSAFVSSVESCVDIDCTTAEQQEASSYFDSVCGVTSTSGASSGASLSGSSSSGSISSGSIATTATTAKTAAAFSLTSSEASAQTSSSGSGLSGFNGSLGSFATPKDLIKIVVAAVMGMVAISQL